jgi:hypothetical protein
MSFIAEAACTFLPCPGGNFRPLEVFSGNMYIPALEHLIIVNDGGDSLDLVTDIGLPSRVEDMRRDQGIVYANCSDGSSEVINIYNPESPIMMGSHNVWDWVSGVEVSGNTFYRKMDDLIEIAIMASE